VVEQVFELDEDELGLQMGVLGQMPSSQTLLSTETLLDTVDISKGGQDGLEVELRALGEVRLGTVVVELEQGRTAFHRCLHHARWGHLGDSLGVESFSESSQQERSHSHDRSGGFTTQLEVSEVRSDRGVGVLRGCG
jgi:hypothetical protein